MIKWVKYMFWKKIGHHLERIEAFYSQMDISRLKKEERYQDAKRLLKYGYKIYSQNDEDGIIREIFNRIGVTNKYFVEFGVEYGLENNTLALLFEGWKGLWVEGSKKYAKKINDNFREVIQSGQLSVANQFITKDNIDDIISRHITGEIDLLSIDIDGNDFHILKAIVSIRPRLIVMEYNAKFVPPIEFCIPYDEKHIWQGDDYFGASLKFLEKNITGYNLVGCNLTGSNAFFVRSDLVGDNFSAPYTAENHYEPPRYYLSPFVMGYPASYNSIRGYIELNSL